MVVNTSARVFCEVRGRLLAKGDLLHAAERLVEDELTHVGDLGTSRALRSAAVEKLVEVRHDDLVDGVDRLGLESAMRQCVHLIVT